MMYCLCYVFLNKERCLNVIFLQVPTLKDIGYLTVYQMDMRVHVYVCVRER